MQKGNGGLEVSASQIKIVGERYPEANMKMTGR